MAYLWVTLAYTKREKEAKNKVHDLEATKADVLECDLYGELSYTYAALSLHWAQDDKERIMRMLRQHQIAMFRTKVVEVDSVDSL